MRRPIHRSLITLVLRLSVGCLDKPLIRNDLPKSFSLIFTFVNAPFPCREAP